ncbi:hypothetical protein HK100_009914 [Physocladia obscura]|uniref:YhhN-like protein n=1 Tax=Physocladia obscura TaxID=109957 RepID=A0AAD5T2V4_9FUNG|nr:hypothetical protein HK100_009914 [Physocladia obscura]
MQLFKLGAPVHIGLTIPHILLVATTATGRSPTTSLTLLAFTKCFPIGILAIETAPRSAALGVGLALSMLGDLFLALGPTSLFGQGLGAFLLAHIAYIKAFQESHPPFSVRAFGAFALVAGSMLRVLLPAVPRNLTIPVTIYTSVLAGMTWRGFARMQQIHQALTKVKAAGSSSSLAAAIASAEIAYSKAKWAFAGGVLFILSDFALAYDQFVDSFAGAHLFVMISYYVAQIAIAGSA